MKNKLEDRPPLSEEVVYWENLGGKLSRSGRGAMLYTEDEPRSIYEIGQQWYFEDVWKLMRSRAKSAHYLELGAGPGTIATCFASRGRDLILVNLSESDLELAKANFALLGFKEATCVLADARDTGLPGENWDCVHSIGLLEHFEDPLPVLRESVRPLRPEGLLFQLVLPAVPSSHLLFSRLLFNPLGTFLRAVQRKGGEDVLGPASLLGEPQQLVMA
jgi:ubiquinone/menaquinone biosynthesis C-methylase UbiE